MQGEPFEIPACSRPSPTEACRGGCLCRQGVLLRFEGEADPQTVRLIRGALAHFEASLINRQIPPAAA